MIELKPSNDTKYLMEIAELYPYHMFPIADAKINIDRGFDVYYNGERAGYIFFQRLLGLYTFDAYKDLRIKNIPIIASLEAGRMAIEKVKHREPVIDTIYNVKNRLSTMLAKKLGFVDMGKYKINQHEVRWLRWE
jgi:hypothetical protein